MKIKHKVVLVEWIDSAGCSGWQEDPITTPLICQSVGFLVRKSKESITLALSFCDDNCSKPYGDMIVIPRGCIKKKKVLK